MILFLQNAFKVTIKVIVKFILSLHFLLVISFMFLYFLPGSFIEDEFIVADKSKISQNFFFELKKYIYSIYQLDLGNSYAHPQTKVIEIISDRYLTSIKIIIYAFVFIVICAFVISFLAIVYKGFFKFLKKTLAVVNAIPLIVILPLLIYIFYQVFGIIPSRYNAENSVSFGFAVFMISFKFVFQLAELMMEKWRLENKNQYIQTAKAKGLNRVRIILNHSLRNILPSIISFSQNIFLSLIAGNFLVESFYSIPGIGLTFVESMSNRDLPLIMASVLVLGCLYFLVNSLSELILNVLQLIQQKESH